MVNFLIAAALAAASPQAPPALPAVEASDIRPAMFAVRDADTIVFIFGTFHALDGQTDWFKDNVRGAFENSDEMVLETLVPEGPDRAQLSSMPRYRGLMTPSASFLATTRMAIDAGRSQGMQLLDDTLLGLVEQGLVSPRDAYLKAGDKTRFEPLLERE